MFLEHHFHPVTFTQTHFNPNTDLPSSQGHQPEYHAAFPTSVQYSFVLKVGLTLGVQIANIDKNKVTLA